MNNMDSAPASHNTWDDYYDSQLESEIDSGTQSSNDDWIFDDNPFDQSEKVLDNDVILIHEEYVQINDMCEEILKKNKTDDNIINKFNEKRLNFLNNCGNWKSIDDDKINHWINLIKKLLSDTQEYLDSVIASELVAIDFYNDNTQMLQYDSSPDDTNISPENPYQSIYKKNILPSSNNSLPKVSNESDTQLEVICESLNDQYLKLAMGEFNWTEYNELYKLFDKECPTYYCNRYYRTVDTIYKIVTLFDKINEVLINKSFSVTFIKNDIETLYDDINQLYNHLLNSQFIDQVHIFKYRNLMNNFVWLHDFENTKINNIIILLNRRIGGLVGTGLTSWIQYYIDNAIMICNCCVWCPNINKYEKIEDTFLVKDEFHKLCNSDMYFESQIQNIERLPIEELSTFFDKYETYAKKLSYDGFERVIIDKFTLSINNNVDPNVVKSIIDFAGKVNTLYINDVIKNLFTTKLEKFRIDLYDKYYDCYKRAEYDHLIQYGQYLYNDKEISELFNRLSILINKKLVSEIYHRFRIINKAINTYGYQKYIKLEYDMLCELCEIHLIEDNQMTREIEKYRKSILSML